MGKVHKTSQNHAWLKHANTLFSNRIAFVSVIKCTRSLRPLLFILCGTLEEKILCKSQSVCVGHDMPTKNQALPNNFFQSEDACDTKLSFVFMFSVSGNNELCGRVERVEFLKDRKGSHSDNRRRQNQDAF